MLTLINQQIFHSQIYQSLYHILNTVEPGALTTGKQLYYGFREKLTPRGQSYDLEDVLLGLGTGIKPQRVDLKRSLDFIIGDLGKIRTEAPKTSPLYRNNLTKNYISIGKELSFTLGLKIGDDVTIMS